MSARVAVHPRFGSPGRPPAQAPAASILATTRLIRAAERAGVEQARQTENAAFAELLRRPEMGEDILRRLDPASRGDEAVTSEQ
ncbi:hypothetical protein [Pseudofrankia sp. DC12]|uniref:hypothetical protein n=1 Tax=Pseudofrankia sp. DC12 TaxID=683315 RepID=UPI0005F836DA|nr:hypothetical protein [Pseudofrankia sp. DC12]